MIKIYTKLNRKINVQSPFINIRLVNLTFTLIREEICGILQMNDPKHTNFFRILSADVRLSKIEIWERVQSKTENYKIFIIIKKQPEK